MKSALASLLLAGTLAAADFSGARATAVVFVSTECPVSNAYNERFVDLHRDYAAKGVKFVFVNSNANETPEAIAKHAKANGFPFDVIKDKDNVLADKLNAQYTPEVFVFDTDGKLAYHGRIDDSREPQGIRAKDTRAALDALLAGKTVPKSETKAFGCTIKRARRTT